MATIKATITVEYDTRDTTVGEARENLTEALDKLREIGHAFGTIAYPEHTEDV